VLSGDLLEEWNMFVTFLVVDDLGLVKEDVQRLLNAK
jgi:hypothetical protein